MRRFLSEFWGCGGSAGVSVGGSVVGLTKPRASRKAVYGTIVGVTFQCAYNRNRTSRPIFEAERNKRAGVVLVKRYYHPPHWSHLQFRRLLRRSVLKHIRVNTYEIKWRAYPTRWKADFLVDSCTSSLPNSTFDCFRGGSGRRLPVSITNDVFNSIVPSFSVQVPLLKYLSSSVH